MRAGEMGMDLDRLLLIVRKRACDEGMIDGHGSC
jgi:hypothetical protein